MKTINEKLKKLQQDIVGDKPITLMILGLASAPIYLTILSIWLIQS